MFLAGDFMGGAAYAREYSECTFGPLMLQHLGFGLGLGGSPT